MTRRCYIQTLTMLCSCRDASASSQTYFGPHLRPGGATAHDTEEWPTAGEPLHAPTPQASIVQQAESTLLHVSMEVTSRCTSI